MSSEAEASSSVRKAAHRAVVRLSSGETIRGSSSLPAASRGMTAPSALAICSIGARFFSLRGSDETALSRDPQPAARGDRGVTPTEAARNPGYSAATRRFVSVVLSTGGAYRHDRVHRPQGTPAEGLVQTAR